MKNLFICMSPFHILIAVKIIEKLNLQKKNCELFFYCHHVNDTIKYYTKKNKNYFFKINIFVIKKRFPSYIYNLKKNFIKKEYKNIYIANKNGLMEQFVLSYCNYLELYTFSEGASSVYEFKKSKTLNEVKKNILFNFKQLVYYCMGKVYTKKTILKVRKLHYTIYNKDLAPKNICKKITNPFSLKKKQSKKEIILVLGTVWEDFKTNENKKFINLKKSFELFIVNLVKKNSKLAIYYLQHPRSEIIPFKNKKIKIIKTHLIAEDFIKKKILSGFKIKIYCSLFSTVFLNLENFNYSIYCLPDHSQDMIDA